MESSGNLESFLHWSQNIDAEFPDLQYPLEQQEGFSWTELLDDYIDPFYLDGELPATAGETPPAAAESLPDLTPATTAEGEDMHGIHQLLIELQNRVGYLENMITQKERTIGALESYVEQLQPYLLQLSNSVVEMQKKDTM